MEKYTNYRNRDPRLTNTEDNRPFWATDKEKYYSEKNYDYFDPLRMDFAGNEFTGELATRQNNIAFDMGYRTRENMMVKPIVFESSWYDFTPRPSPQIVPDASKYLSNPVLPVSFDYKNNNIDKKLFTAKNKYFNKKNNLYTPIEGMFTKPQYQKPYCANEEKAKFYTSDTSYNPAPKRKIVHQKKMDDYAAEPREYYKNANNQTFANIDQSISILSDQFMKIGLDYSLPLWNVRDNFDSRSRKK